ncbi:MAG: AsnC family protein [Phycisphaeraceae bacterium]|nr:AsnC family protein [Phycisphaeraceae bacterium]
MGLTIHYSLKAPAMEVRKARSIVKQLQQHARTLPFQEVGELLKLSGEACQGWEHERNPGRKWLLTQAHRFMPHGTTFYPVAPTYLLAFTTVPGAGSEVANFGLCRYPRQMEVKDPHTPDGTGTLETGLDGWRWQSFCKTQYASNPVDGGTDNFLRCHEAVVSMLDFCQTLGILDTVNDESGYWERRDRQALIQEVERWNRRIASFYGQAKDTLKGNLVSPIGQYPNFEWLEAEGRKEEDSSEHHDR